MPRYIAWPNILIAVVVGAASAATALKPARIVARIATGQTRCSENGGLGALRVSNFRDATIARIDPTTNRVTGLIKVGPQPCGVVVGAGALWVDGYGTGSVERVDPQTSQIVARIPVGPSLWDVEFGADAVWATSEFNGTVSRIDSATDAIVATIKGGHGTASGPVRGGRDLGREPQPARASTVSTRRRTRRAPCRSVSSLPIRSRSAMPRSG
jgi:DNA-binding beta-propeller fold protein YncE